MLPRYHSHCGYHPPLDSHNAGMRRAYFPFQPRGFATSFGLIRTAFHHLDDSLRRIVPYCFASTPI